MFNICLIIILHFDLSSPKDHRKNVTEQSISSYSSDWRFSEYLSNRANFQFIFSFHEVESHYEAFRKIHQSDLQGGDQLGSFFTWETLATLTGFAAATAVITQFVKDLPFLKNIATQWVSYVIAAILLLGATFFTGALTLSSGALIPFNAILIALSANGAYSAIVRASAAKNKNENQ